MDMGTVGWFALGWLTVALVLSVALGGFLRKVNESPGEDDLALAASRQKGLRFLRGRNSAVGRTTATAPRTRDTGKRNSN